MLDGVSPFPAEFAARYRELGYWEDRPLFDGFSAALALYSGQVAIADEAGPVTYGQLDERSQRLARVLLDLGFRPLDRIIVQLPNTAMFACLYFALQRIGACPVLVLRPGFALDLAELVTFLRGFDIASFKLPERLECLDTLPLSGFGKVSKKDLAAMLAAS